jgi:hypothetical protein
VRRTLSDLLHLLVVLHGYRREYACVDMGRMYSKQCPAASGRDESAGSGVGVELMLLSTVGLVVLNCPCAELAEVFGSHFGRRRGRRGRCGGGGCKTALARDGSFARRDQQRD